MPETPLIRYLAIWQLFHIPQSALLRYKIQAECKASIGREQTKNVVGQVPLTLEDVFFFLFFLERGHYILL